MSIKLKIIFAVVFLFILSSCEKIKDDYVDCGVWLEFVFDNNMEYADSFDPQVKTVDVYVFDRSDKFVFARYAAINDLNGRKRMFIGGGLPFGEYKVLTVGNLGASFSFTGKSGEAFTPGVTSLEEAVLALNTSYTAKEFDHLFFGLPVEVDYKTDLSVWRVPLIRETNKFNIVLQTVVESLDGTPQGAVEPMHSVEILAPESGAYDRLNNPTDPRELIYRPWSLMSRLDCTEGGVLQETAAKINTMRLLENEWNGYRIIIRDIETGDELYSNDLLSLLAATKPDKQLDGTDLPRSEYFDRQGDWDIVIVYKSIESIDNPDPAEQEAFVALRIIINNWVVWQQGVVV